MTATEFDVLDGSLRNASRGPARSGLQADDDKTPANLGGGFIFPPDRTIWDKAKDMSATVIHEILLPTAEPDYEWVRGRALQKMSPASIHSYVQKALLRIVDAWATNSNSGEVGPEWRVRILPAGSLERRPLTPDVAYFSNERLATISGSSAKDAEYPPLAPDISFEVISESDEKADIEAKRADYLNAGALRVVEVYPDSRELHAWKAPWSLITVASTGTWTDESFPGLAIHVADLFLQYDTFIQKLGE